VILCSSSEEGGRGIVKGLGVQQKRRMIEIGLTHEKRLV